LAFAVTVSGTTTAVPGVSGSPDPGNFVVRGYDQRSGAVRWTDPDAGNWRHYRERHDGASSAPLVTAFDMANGNVLWERVNEPYGLLTSIQVHGRRLVAGGSDRRSSVNRWRAGR
jgi:hypothetical protein